MFTSEIEDILQILKFPKSNFKDSRLTKINTTDLKIKLRRF